MYALHLSPPPPPTHVRKFPPTTTARHSESPDKAGCLTSRTLLPILQRRRASSSQPASSILRCDKPPPTGVTATLWVPISSPRSIFLTIQCVVIHSRNAIGERGSVGPLQSRLGRTGGRSFVYCTSQSGLCRLLDSPGNSFLSAGTYPRPDCDVPHGLCTPCVTWTMASFWVAPVCHGYGAPMAVLNIRNILRCMGSSQSHFPFQLPTYERFSHP